MLAYALILLGAYALYEDSDIVNNACGKSYHLFKFCGLNVCLWVFACFSYCLWKGGGEGARARAMVLTIFYGASCIWGTLLWQELSIACTEVFDKQFNVIFFFHHAATVFDGIAATLFFVHEMWLGKYVGADLTVMAEVHHRMNPVYLPERVGVTVDQGAYSHATMPVQSPPTSAPAEMDPTLTHEYAKIMQNNTSSSSTLPQTTP